MSCAEAESGRTIEAEFLELRDGKVCLRRMDGKVFQLDPNQLSEADRDYVQAASSSRPDGTVTLRAESKPQKTSQSGSEADSQIVIAEGLGITSGDALDEAFRQAVRQVVGTFVDAETLVMNDQLVSDKILTYSNGYISNFKKLRETEQNGLVRVTIQAAVKREQLIAKLSEENVSVNPLPGAKLFAQAVSQTAAERDAHALLRSALVGFPHSIIVAASEGEPKIEERSDEKVAISYGVQIAVDIQKYTQFQQRLTRVLEQIAKHKGETTVMKTRDTRSIGGYVQSLESWASSAVATNSGRTFRDPGMQRTKMAKLPSFETAGAFSAPLWPCYYRGWEAPLDENSDFVFVVNRNRTRTHDRTTWKWYCVPKAAVATAEEFGQLRTNMYVQGKHVVCPDQAKIQVEFLDRQDMAVAADEIFIRWSAPGSRVDVSSRGATILGCTWVISPYVISSYAYARSVTIPRRLELPVSTLAEIDSVRFTVTAP